MKNSLLPLRKSECALELAELERYAEGWFLTSEISQHSSATIANRKLVIRNLLWFLKHKKCSECGVLELRQFLAYVTNGHKEPGGRWGNPQETSPVKPSTVVTYHRIVRTLFRWIVDEDDGRLESSPMERIPVPTSREDHIDPFTPEQVNALLAAAKRSRHPRRDEAICYFLLDTGLRASEICSLRLQDVDTSGRRATVVGKGNKRRTVSFQKTTSRALWQYLKQEERDPEDPLFVSERGEALPRLGLLQMIERLGKEAKITAARCSPHTFRHTFAVEFLRAGGNVFTLQQILGHTSLTMTNRYVKLAQADIENQHRQFSPVERLKGNRK